MQEPTDHPGAEPNSSTNAYDMPNAFESTKMIGIRKDVTNMRGELLWAKGTVPMVPTDIATSLITAQFGYNMTLHPLTRVIRYIIRGRQAGFAQ